MLCAPGVPDCAGVEAGTVCSAIGHAKCAGGTPAWNRFGLDFRRLGSRWSKELCAIDSDGDGASNGAELGDPCCVYDYDDPATFDLIDTTGPVSHPGSNKSVVPDYVRFPDPICKPRPVEWATIRTNMQTTEEYDPSFFLKGEEQLVKRFTMQRFEIPVDMKSAKPDTVYEWVSWNWDGCTDKDCYLVGIEVDSRLGSCAQCPPFLVLPWRLWEKVGSVCSLQMVINNTEMSHHWTISSCDSPPLTDPELDGVPTLTGQAQECIDLVGAWTPGRNPVVKASPESSRQFPKLLAGFNGNVHYNNPELKVGQTDQSSWLLYYTTQPRQYKIGQFFPLVISVAPFIKLDAAKERKFITSGCTLSGLDEPIHAEGIWNHAHLAGTGMYMEASHTLLPCVCGPVLGTSLGNGMTRMSTAGLLSRAAWAARESLHAPGTLLPNMIIWTFPAASRQHGRQHAACSGPQPTVHHTCRTTRSGPSKISTARRLMREHGSSRTATTFRFC